MLNSFKDYLLFSSSWHAPEILLFSDKERGHVWQENCHVLWLTRLDNISEMTPLWRLCWFPMLPQPAKRNKLHTMKYFVGDPHSYHDHYVIQSGKTASVTSGLSQWSAAKRKQHWRWELFLLIQDNKNLLKTVARIK